MARRNFNPRFDTVRPAGIAYCENPHDVSECLNFVRRFGLPVTPRCGGHSYTGASLVPGLVIDVSPMSAIRADAPSETATIGAGARLIDVYDKLSAADVSIPAGSCPTVGISGLTLGGGIGVVSRAHGVLSDNLRAIELVTADGRKLTCDAKNNSDLFWACRGGGGATFGVVTSFTFATHPTSEIVVFFLNWPWSAARSAIDAWQHSREPEYAASQIFTRPMDGTAIDTILAAVQRRGGLSGGGQGGIALDALGGAVNRVAPDATALVHRNGLFNAQITTTWTTDAPTDAIRAQQNWLRSLHAAMKPSASGQAYQNYADAGLTDWKQAYFGANYPRLLTVKNRYDPDRVFRIPQTVGTATK
ncbi:FAD-dependent oxidoreductase [Actinoallomurus sp. NPDC052308]|uniref:FAD-binding oxidoreductase n=1 Tax=Actinoallomurus sp. NPDC052308 TaxID=3155530 RepID=UPI0034173E16